MHSCGLPTSPQAGCAGRVSSYVVATQKEEHDMFHMKFILTVNWVAWGILNEGDNSMYFAKQILSWKDSTFLSDMGCTLTGRGSKRARKENLG